MIHGKEGKKATGRKIGNQEGDQGSPPEKGKKAKEQLLCSLELLTLFDRTGSLAKLAPWGFLLHPSGSTVPHCWIIDYRSAKGAGVFLRLRQPCHDLQADQGTTAVLNTQNSLSMDHG